MTDVTAGGAEGGTGADSDAGPDGSAGLGERSAGPGERSAGQPAAGKGLDAVKAALAAARAAAHAQGMQPGDQGAPTQARHRAAQAARRARRRGSRYTGAGPDQRDPQPFGPLVEQFLAERGWSHEVAVGGVVGRWAQIVGEDISAHAHPETFVDGVLTIRTSSSAWATQMRLLAPRILARLDEEVGVGVVRRLAVLAPAAPSWRRGPRAAPGGRGPRDTYG